MQAVNAIERGALTAAREELWYAALRAVGAAAALTFAVVVGIGAGGGPVWWLAIGFGASVLWGAGDEVWSAWRCERDIRRCSTCRAASIGLADAERVWDRCSGAGHPDPRAGAK